MNFCLLDELVSGRAFRVMRPRMPTMVRDLRLGFRADALRRLAPGAEHQGPSTVARAPWAKCWRLFAGLINTGSIEIETEGVHKFTLGESRAKLAILVFFLPAAP
jgi:hypothetical protein